MSRDVRDKENYDDIEETIIGHHTFGHGTI